MDVIALLIDSWVRQSRIVNTVAALVTEENRDWSPTENGISLFRQLAHIHHCRKEFLGQLDAELAASLADSYLPPDWKPVDNLAELKALLEASGKAVGEAVETALRAGKEQAGWYDNPVLYLQHMIWHEGWHVGQIFQALRAGGQEPSDEWEEQHVWGEWRTEVWEG